MSSRLRTEGIPPISRPYITPCYLTPYGDPGPRIGLHKVWQGDNIVAPFAPMSLVMHTLNAAGCCYLAGMRLGDGINA
jgi:hypothetical protein